jgi:hypothetical protein
MKMCSAQRQALQRFSFFMLPYSLGSVHENVVLLGQGFSLIFLFATVFLHTKHFSYVHTVVFHHVALVFTALFSLSFSTIATL